MTSSSALAGSHLRAYTTSFQHPLSHNLGWHDVYAMLRQLGHFEEETNGQLRVTRSQAKARELYSSRQKISA